MLSAPIVRFVLRFRNMLTYYEPFLQARVEKEWVLSAPIVRFVLRFRNMLTYYEPFLQARVEKEWGEEPKKSNASVGNRNTSMAGSINT